MVRYYKRKKEIPYSKENLLKAVEEVKSKRMSSYQAAEYFGVPRSTISAHVSGTRGQKNTKPGRLTVFSKDTELKIVNCIHVMEKCGYPLTRKEVLSLISEYIRRNGITTVFKNDIPGDDWFRGFKRRHNLSLKKPQSVEIARRKACNPFTVYDYFEILEKIVIDLDLSSAPDRIYNLDETSFCQDPLKSKVVGKIGYRCTRTTSSPGRSNTTVLLAANANGDKVPPLIIFQGKYLWNEWFFQNENIKTAYAVSKKGWMETSIFEKYIKDVFVPAIGSERPVLLIYDGHSTHIDLSVIEVAMSNGITILKLPPHSSDVLQPLDCSVMKPLKDRWDEELIKWQRLHVGFKLPKSEFAKILTRIWENLNPVIISNGFKKTGIYPVNRNMISKEKFDTLMWQKWENHLQSLHNCDNTANEDDPAKYNNFEIMTMTPNDRTNDAVLANSVVTTETFQEIPRLKDLTLRIMNLSINQFQNNYDKSNRKEDNMSTDGESLLMMNNKRKKYENIVDYKKTSSNKEPAIYENKKEISNKENYIEYVAKMVEKPNNISKTYKRKQMDIHDKSGWIEINNPKTFRLPSTSSNLSLKILSSEVIKPAGTYKQEKNYDAVDTSFEKLVLSTIARDDEPKKPKKRVGAEILTYPDVVSRMKKAKEEQEKIKLNKEKKKQEQQDKKNRNNRNETKKLEKKQKLMTVKKNKKRVSDSESTGSYSLKDLSENEDMDSFFNNILNENMDACEIIESNSKQNEVAEILTCPDVMTSTKKAKEKQEKLKQNKEKKKQDKKNRKETKKIKKKPKQMTVKKNKKLVSDSESTGSYSIRDSSENEDLDSFFNNILKENEDAYEFTETNLNRKGCTQKQTFETESFENELNSDSDHSTLMKPSTSKDPCLSRPKNKCGIPEKGTFVLAKFTSYKGKKAYKYVCLIEEISYTKIVIQGLKSIKNSKRKFRLVDNDVSIIEHDDIIECLPAPKFDKKDMLYIFPRDVAILEI